MLSKSLTLRQSHFNSTQQSASKMLEDAPRLVIQTAALLILNFPKKKKKKSNKAVNEEVQIYSKCKYSFLYPFT